MVSFRVKFILLMARVDTELSLVFTLGTSIYMEHAVAQLVEALSYNPEGRGFDSG